MFAELRGRTGVVTRDEAMTVPAVAKARNQICSIATLPLNQLDAVYNQVRSPFLEQIDPDVANVVTLAQTLEDLVFDAIAWWRVTAKTADGFPFYARRYDPDTVSLEPPPNARMPAPLPSGEDPRGAVVWMDGEPVPANQVIRFDSPNRAVRKVLGDTIRRAIRLSRAGTMYADNQRPLDYFSPADGEPEHEDDEIEEVLDDWITRRKRSSTGYVPQWLKYNTVDSPTPADLQLAELKREATLDVANALGVDPEDLGVSTTSRTYANAVDRRIDRINDLLAPYMLAISQRLSMGDVTKRGYTVVFDVDDYMKSNPTERWNTYQTAKNIGAITVDEIRENEKKPPLPTDQSTSDSQPADTPADQPAAPAVASVAAGGNVVAMRFEDTPALRFADVPVEQFSVDTASRTIEGIVVPYGKVGVKYGVGFRFERGSIHWSDPTRVKLLRDHDPRQPLGYASDIRETPQGLKVKFKVGRGHEGDRALEMAEDKVLDGLSIGVDFSDAVDTVPDPKNKGGLLVRRSDLREVSLTPMPAFDDARVTRVAASLDGGFTMEPCSACGHQHAQGAPCGAPALQPAGAHFGQGNGQPAGLAPGWGYQPAQLPVQGQQLPAQGQQPPAQGQPLQPVQQFGQLGMPQLLQIAQAMQQQGGQQPPAQPAQPPADQGPTFVDPTRRLQAGATVTEPPSYYVDMRGNLRPGKFDFSQDLFAAFSGDVAAHDRAIDFVRKQFDVATGDVNELNPTRNRPDMYVDQKDFTYPIWETIDKGTLTDITPFTFPKFSSASGLVGAHTEGAEPSSGTIVTTSQTVTPTAISGKAKITRETWDQGGNPQVSGLIWRQMVKGWYEALEAAAVALLDGVTPTGITLTAGGGTTGQTLSSELEAAFANLQYIRGGFRFTDMFTQIDLYKGLAAAKDDAGRPLYPRLGATNANGTARERFAAMDVAGVLALPAWALAATGSVAASSYLFDRADVHGWASTPQRLEFNIEVAHVYIGIWGYKATAISDLTGVREIIYDPVP